MPRVGPLLAGGTALLSALAGPLVLRAQPFDLVTRAERPPEMGEITVCDLTSPLGGFTFAPPPGWRLQVERSAKLIKLSPADSKAQMELCLAGVNPALTPAVSPDALQKQVLKRFPEAKVVEQFTCSSAGYSGLAFDLTWKAATNVPLMARFASVPCPGGTLEFCLTTSPQEFPNYVPFFGAFLSSLSRASNPKAAGSGTQSAVPVSGSLASIVWPTPAGPASPEARAPNWERLRQDLVQQRMKEEQQAGGVPTETTTEPEPLVAQPEGAPLNLAWAGVLLLAGVFLVRRFSQLVNLVEEWLNPEALPAYLPEAFGTLSASPSSAGSPAVSKALSWVGEGDFGVSPDRPGDAFAHVPDRTTGDQISSGPGQGAPALGGRIEPVDLCSDAVSAPEVARPPGEAVGGQAVAQGGSLESKGDSDRPSEPMRAFFDRVPQELAAWQDVLVRIGQPADEQARRGMLTDLSMRVQTLAQQAGLAKLPCVSKISSVLDGLLKKLVENPRNVTASTLHSVTTAVDLLKDLSVPGVRADLVAKPAVRMLVVDDDALARRGLTYALQLAFEKPDSAENGAAALALAGQKSYDVIFLDVGMPGMNGFTLCSKIHQTTLNRQTPVVFVTSHSDEETRAQAARSGGLDFITKPFLFIEITLKALTLAARGRLDSPREAADSCRALHPPSALELSGPKATGAVLILPDEPGRSLEEPARAETVKEPEPKASALAGGTGLAELCPGAGHAPAAARPSGHESANVPRSPGPGGTSELSHATPRPPEGGTLTQRFIESKGDSAGPSEQMRNSLARVPQELAAWHDILAQVGVTADLQGRKGMLTDLATRVQTLMKQAGLAKLPCFSKITSALEGLLRKLGENPRNLTPSTLGSLADAVDLLKDLAVPGLRTDLASDPPVRMLVVDDDALARRALTYSLQVAFDKPDGAENGAAALALAGQKPYDLIFLDVRMPGMDGFTLCSKIHETCFNRQTPVVFVTSQSDEGSRAQAAQSGASDFITKPFLLIEITLKALTLALRGRLQPRVTTSLKEPACLNGALNAVEGPTGGDGRPEGPA
jgi:CheY-like chemotaxis protein